MSQFSSTIAPPSNCSVDTKMAHNPMALRSRLLAMACRALKRSFSQTNMKLMLGASLSCLISVAWGAHAEAQTPKAANQKATKGGKNVNVVIETSMGKIEVELNSEAAPKTVANFLSYVDKKHYDGTIFHRVIPGFMIQGGGMDANMKEKSTGEPIKNEATNGLKNDRGTLAMARTNIVDSATAQFFINVKDNAFLNHKAPNPREFGYAVFGKVTSGMDVADQIVAVPRGRKGPHDDVPETPVNIIGIRRK